LAASRLKERYNKEVVPELMSKFGYKNVMQVPRLSKIVLNIGLGEATQNPKALESAEKDLAAITGQHPVITRAKKSIAAFKLRAGMPIGISVILRGGRMYDFFDKLVSVVLARIRDFQGVPQDSFDGQGNYTLGMKEQIVFPEIDYDKVDKLRGLEIVIVTTANNNEEGRGLLESMGMPFRKS
jgi:large subunit ribosomal protein L5